MEFFGKFWPLILAAGAVGAFFAPILGYFSGQRVGSNAMQRTVTMDGAAIVDSAAIQALIAETARQANAVERMADGMEAILHQMSETADAEAERARTAAAVAAEREKWERERDQHERAQRDREHGQQ